MFKKTLLFLFFLHLSIANLYAASGKQIRIVGSSTALPFTSLLAERFGKDTDFRTPIVEANGTGGGIYQFCAGSGPDFPDIVATSRPITSSEKKRCQRYHVGDVIELKIGYDGIIIGQSQHARPFALSAKELRSAIAYFIWDAKHQRFAKNPYKNWQEINPKFPDMPIRIIGPAPHTGTREMLEQKLMLTTCGAIAQKNQCLQMRDDGYYIAANANENLIINKIIQSPETIGIFGYSFYEENRNKITPIHLNRIAPSYLMIQVGTYPLSRGLYLYVKKTHLKYIPGLKAFVKYITQNNMIGAEGILREKSFISLLPSQLEILQNKVRTEIE